MACHLCNNLKNQFDSRIITQMTCRIHTCISNDISSEHRSYVIKYKD